MFPWWEIYLPYKNWFGHYLLTSLEFVDETFHNANSELRELPAVELSTLPLILKVLFSSFVSYIIVSYLCYFSHFHLIFYRTLYDVHLPFNISFVSLFFGLLYIHARYIIHQKRWKCICFCLADCGWEWHCWSDAPDRTDIEWCKLHITL